MSDQWVYASNSGQAGPVSTAELQALVAAGTVRPTDLVWRDGLGDWIPASEVSELFPTATAKPATPVMAMAAHPAQARPVQPQPMYATPLQATPSGVLPYQGGGDVQISVSSHSVELLRQTRPWVMFFSVIGFLVTGLVVLATLLTTIGMAGGRQGVAGMIGMIFNLAMGALYFFPALFLWRYGSRISALTATQQVRDLEGALEAQKSFWKFAGILTIVAIVLSLAMFVGIVMLIAR